MLVRAGSGITALMSALIHGVPAPLDGDGSKFDSSFIFKRPDSTTTFRRELNCCLTEVELHERLVVLNAKADDERLSGVERRELQALRRPYPAPLSVEVDTVEAVQQDHVR
jgi:hypothetical protein